MKYIKEYNEVNDMSKLEDLSEYLQEIFDKYSILYVDNPPYRDNINSNTWCFGRVGKSKLIEPIIQIDFTMVDRDSREQYYTFREDLGDITPQIEKRIGSKLRINKFPSGRILIRL